MNEFYHQQELLRLSSDNTKEITCKNFGSVKLSVISNSLHSLDVLTKVKFIMTIIADKSIKGWPEIEEWKKLLPEWFNDSLRSPYTKVEMEAELSKWRRLSPNDRLEYEKRVKWDMVNWIQTMSPQSRAWLWMDGIIKNDSSLEIYILIKEYPFPWDNLRFLLQASGAIEVEMNE